MQYPVTNYNLGKFRGGGGGKGGWGGGKEQEGMVFVRK